MVSFLRDLTFLGWYNSKNFDLCAFITLKYKMKSILNKVVEKFNPYKFCGEFIEENTLMKSITISSYFILSRKM